MRTNIASGYQSWFNPKTGFYARETDPFKCPLPELLDISITSRCTRHCEFCYMASSPLKEDYITLGNLEKILDHSPWVYQIALGGGEPTIHPQFVEILKTIRQRNVVPNYTTNSDNLSEEVIEATSQYCGAMAISVYDVDRVVEASKHLIGRGIKVNWHWVLSRESLPKIVDFLKQKKVPVGLNAIIFLLHKPIGRGQASNCLTLEDRPQLSELYDTLKTSGIKGGFDACAMNWILSSKLEDVDERLVDFCDAGRYSAYLDWDLNMSPCSFGRGEANSFSLKEFSMQEIWDNKFEPYRQGILHSCCENKCPKGIYNKCYSGCPILPINLCEERGKELVK